MNLVGTGVNADTQLSEPVLQSLPVSRTIPARHRCLFGLVFLYIIQGLLYKLKSRTS